MKNVEIENKVKVIDDGRGDFFMVDLIVDGVKIDAGDNPIESYSFWKDIEDESQRALYRIKKNNPKMNFKFDLSTMGMSDEQIEQRFRNHIKDKYKSIDVDKIFEILDSEFAEMQLTGPDDNHPNPFKKFPIDSQLTKNLVVCVIDKLVKAKVYSI